MSLRSCLIITLIDVVLAIADDETEKPNDNCFENIANYPNECLESLYDIKNVENVVETESSSNVQVWLNSYCNEVCVEAANVYYNCLGNHDHIHYLRSVACTQHDGSHDYCLVRIVDGRINGNFSLSDINSTCRSDHSDDDGRINRRSEYSSSCCSKLQLLHQYAGCCITSLTSDSMSGLSHYVSKSFFEICQLSLPRECPIVYKHSGAELASPFSCTVFLMFVMLFGFFHF